MATWIAHMRVAEHFIKKYNALNNETFLVGNIGPDCGVPNEDWSIFTPDKNITHWWSKDGTFIDADDFRSKYLNTDDSRYPFYLGYYFHLLTDVEWSKMCKRKPVYDEKIKKDKSFIWTIKKDWYGQDHLFLKRNPDFVFFSVFSHINEFDNTFFDFYPQNAFIRQIKYITEFYSNADEDSMRDFPYLNKTEMDDFVQETIKIIEEIYQI